MCCVVCFELMCDITLTIGDVIGKRYRLRTINMSLKNASSAHEVKKTLSNILTFLIWKGTSRLRHCPCHNNQEALVIRPHLASQLHRSHRLSFLFHPSFFTLKYIDTHFIAYNDTQLKCRHNPRSPKTSETKSNPPTVQTKPSTPLLAGYTTHTQIPMSGVIPDFREPLALHMMTNKGCII